MSTPTSSRSRVPSTAKDFLTWHATVLAAVALALLGGRAQSERARRRVVPQALCEVARLLGNTPTVCRTSYVDPRVIERFYEGKTIRVELEARRGYAGLRRPALDRAVGPETSPADGQAT